MLLNMKPADYVSLSSLVCAVIAIALIFNKAYLFVPWLIFLCIGLDYADGYAARSMKQKNSIGPYLEGFIDTVAFGITPPLFIASVIGFDIITTILLIIVVVANVLRETRILTLLETQSKYKTGMANPVFAAITGFLFLSQLAIPAYAWQLFMLVGGFLLISPFRYPTHRNIQKRVKYAFVIAVFVILVLSYALTALLQSAYAAIALILIGYMILGPVIYKWAL